MEQRSAAGPSPEDDRLVDAAAEVLAEVGWEGLTLQAVADRAGVSRVTVWRQAGSRDQLATDLVRRLASDYQVTLWPIMTGPGSGHARLRAALNAMCDVADRHLPLLLASDIGFRHGHSEVMHAVRFSDPIVRLLRDANADGSLTTRGDPEALGEVVFNAVYWPYVHLRGRHRWSAARVKEVLLPLVLAGLPSAGAGRQGSLGVGAHWRAPKGGVSPPLPSAGESLLGD